MLRVVSCFRTICTMFHFRNKIRGNEQFMTIYLYFGSTRIYFIDANKTLVSDGKPVLFFEIVR